MAVFCKKNQSKNENFFGHAAQFFFLAGEILPVELQAMLMSSAALKNLSNGVWYLSVSFTLYGLWLKTSVVLWGKKF